MSRGTSSPVRTFDEGRLMQVLVSPIVSEKSTLVTNETNAVVFRVLRDATKHEIKAAVELMFKVTVRKVCVTNIQGKPRRFGKTVGRKNHVRKAYVMLNKDQTIDLNGEVA